MHAAASSDVNTVRLLVKHGADLNARDGSGCTAFRHAIEYGRNRTLSALIELGADVNLKDNNNISPLAIARQEDHTDAVKLLEKAGAKQ
jgi:ankyrin repeat protein